MSQNSDADFAVALASNPASGVACPKKNLRIVLVDDNVVMRQGLAGLFRAEPDVEIVGEAPDGESAVNLIREVQVLFRTYGCQHAQDEWHPGYPNRSL
jgi:hypothetical protein